MPDDYSNFNCEWCSKSCIWKDRHIKVVDEVTYTLCGTCNSFPTKALRDSGIAIIIALAINPELSEQFGYPWI